MPRNQYLANQQFFKETDIFLASYPRSGNTWMRLLLSDALLQLQGFQTTTGGNLIPDAYKVDVNQWNKSLRIKLPFRVIKIHEPLFIEEKLEIENRIIYLFRKPADCLCSYYHYTLRYQKNREKNGIEFFCLDHVNQWCNHLKNYIDLKEKNTENVVFISYEKLNCNPVQVLQQVLILLGWTECQSICQKAVENQEFKKVQRLAKQENPEKMGFWEDGGYQNFFRKGKINSGKEELSSQTMKIIEEKAMPIYRQAKMLEPVFPFDFSGIGFDQKLASLKKDKQTKYIFYYNQAKKKYRKGELIRAIDMYRQAIELNSTSAWSYYNLAETLRKQGKIDEAITAYHQAIELKPRTASFQYKLAEALVKKGNLEEAINHYQKASELNPDFPLFQRKLAEIIKLHQEVSERPNIIISQTAFA